MTISSKRGSKARLRGRWAERATLWLMWLKGWSLVAHNLQVGRWELDLLMSRGEELRLLEVKFRRAGAWTSADTALSFEQRLRLQGALRSYLDRVPWPGTITFQRVSWSGTVLVFHKAENWISLKIH